MRYWCRAQRLPFPLEHRSVNDQEIRHMKVGIERANGIMVASIDDGKANALNLEVIAELRSALSSAIDEKAPLIITGRDGYFSAGFDLQIMRSGDRDRISELAGQGSLLFRDILAAPIPVVAACGGHALAAGALLLLAADYRIGQPGRYTIGLNETRIGIALPQFAIDIARFRLSTNRLVAATLFATVLTPEEACAYGYLDRIEPEARTAAHALATEMASLKLAAFATSKKRMNAEIVRQLSDY
jgi:enoyl-CoA hydratase